MTDADFSELTPCGGCCNSCEFKKKGECQGCRVTHESCVKLWDNGCRIYKCCEEHGVYFCGLCGEFPCKWLSETIVLWDSDGIRRLSELRDEYIKLRKE